MISKKAGAGLALSACSLLAFSGSWADPGLEATLGLSQRVENVEESGFDRPRREGLRSVTALDFGLSSETRTQRLVFGASTDLIWNSEATDEFDVENPSYSLGYGLESRRSALDVAASFRSTDVDRNIFIPAEDGDEDPGEFIDDRGTIDRLSLRTTLTLGREGPVGLVLSHGYTERTFSGTTESELRDSTTQSLSARASFVLSPVATVGLSASYRDFSQSGVGGNSRTNRNVGIDGQYRVSKVTTVTAGLSHQRIESTTAPTRDGLGLSFGVRHERPNGVLGFALSRDQSVNGDRTEASVSRSYVFPRGQLSASVGLSRTGDLDVQAVGSASLNYQLGELSQLTLSLSQRAATAADNTETVLTRFSVGVSQELTAQSSLSANLQLVSRDEVGAGGIDRSSVRAGLTYRQALTDDWNLVSGYERTLNRNDARADRTTDTVFFGLQRNFSFRP